MGTAWAMSRTCHMGKVQCRYLGRCRDIQRPGWLDMSLEGEACDSKRCDKKLCVGSGA